MVSKKETVQKTLRLDMCDAQALDVIAAKTNRPINELISVGLQFLFSDNLYWLADGYFEEAEPQAFKDTVEWIEKVKSFDSFDNLEKENFPAFNPYEFRCISKNAYDSAGNMSPHLWYPALPLPLNQNTTPNMLLALGLFNGSICACYQITNPQGMILEKSTMALFYGNDYSKLRVESLLTPVFARYFCFMPFIRQKYVEKVCQKLSDIKQQSAE